MKAATIAKEIKKKMDDWISHIEDKELAKDVLANVVVTGGCIVSMYLRETVNDFDIYIKDKQVLKRLVQYYCAKFKSVWHESPQIIFDKDHSHGKIGIEPAKWNRIGMFIKSKGFMSEPKEKPTDVTLGKYRPVFLSENAITLSDKIQIVVRFWGEPSIVHESFDFEHAKGYWTLQEGLVSTARQLQLIIAKELEYTGSEYPLASIFRSRKFIMRDWTMHVKNYLLMALQLQALDLTDINVLRDQLTGVDAAYLHWIVREAERYLEEEDDDGNKVHDSLSLEYIFEIVMRATGEFGDEHENQEEEAVNNADIANMSPLQKGTSPSN